MDPIPDNGSHMGMSPEQVIPEPPEGHRIFCAHCHAGHLFPDQQWAYGGDIVCRSCWRTACEADANNS